MPRTQQSPITAATRKRAVASARRSRKLRGADPTTCNLRQYDDDEFEFLRAIEAYKSAHDRRFPSNSELYRILLGLGYRKVAESKSA